MLTEFSYIIFHAVSVVLITDLKARNGVMR